MAGPDIVRHGTQRDVVYQHWHLGVGFLTQTPRAKSANGRLFDHVPGAGAKPAWPGNRGRMATGEIVGGILAHFKFLTCLGEAGRSLVFVLWMPPKVLEGMLMTMMTLPVMKRVAVMKREVD